MKTHRSHLKSSSSTFSSRLSFFLHYSTRITMYCGWGASQTFFFFFLRTSHFCPDLIGAKILFISSRFYLCCAETGLENRWCWHIPPQLLFCLFLFFNHTARSSPQRSAYVFNFICLGNAGLCFSLFAAMMAVTKCGQGFAGSQWINLCKDARNLFAGLLSAADKICFS